MAILEDFMATWDGSGDIGFTNEELRKIMSEMKKALDNSPEGGAVNDFDWCEYSPQGCAGQYSSTEAAGSGR